MCMGAVYDKMRGLDRQGIELRRARWQQKRGDSRASRGKNEGANRRAATGPWMHGPARAREQADGRSVREVVAPRSARRGTDHSPVNRVTTSPKLGARPKGKGGNGEGDEGRQNGRVSHGRRDSTFHGHHRAGSAPAPAEADSGPEPLPFPDPVANGACPTHHREATSMLRSRIASSRAHAMNDTAAPVPEPIEVSATFEGGLEGSVSGSVSLGEPPAPKPPSRWKPLLFREDTMIVLRQLTKEIIEQGSEWIGPFVGLFRRGERPATTSR